MAGLVALIRHADAGDRAAWVDDDSLRPLTRKGGRQAEALVQTLGMIPFARLLSSPHLRCLQTLEPLAAALALPIEHVDALVEGAPATATLALLDELGDAQAALCTHGDVIANVCDMLVARGLVAPEHVELRKASTWLLRTEEGSIVQARYVPRRSR
jgi:8-oxo-(d)GTP phosphatase